MPEHDECVAGGNIAEEEVRTYIPSLGSPDGLSPEDIEAAVRIQLGGEEMGSVGVRCWQSRLPIRRWSTDRSQSGWGGW